LYSNTAAICRSQKFELTIKTLTRRTVKMATTWLKWKSYSSLAVLLAASRTLATPSRKSEVRSRDSLT